MAHWHLPTACQKGRLWAFSMLWHFVVVFEQFNIKLNTYIFQSIFDKKKETLKQRKLILSMAILHEDNATGRQGWQLLSHDVPKGAYMGIFHAPALPLRIWEPIHTKRSRKLDQWRNMLWRPRPAPASVSSTLLRIAYSTITLLSAIVLILVCWIHSFRSLPI